MEEEPWTSMLARYTYAMETAVRPPRPNVFRIAGFPDREAVSSNMLAWLLDPSAEHGLGDLALGSLLALTGHDPEGADEAGVETEAVTGRRNRIDILVTMPGLAIAVENKVKAGLYNDLGDYRDHAAGTNPDGNAIVVVLSRNGIADRPDSHEWRLTEGADLFYLTYDQLFDAILSGLGRRIMDADPRGVDLLIQYIDNYSPERNEKAMEDIDNAINRFISRSQGIERQIIASRIDFDAYAKAVSVKLDNVMELVANRIEDGLRDPEGNAVSVTNAWHWPKQGRTPLFHGITAHMENRRDVNIELFANTDSGYRDCCYGPEMFARPDAFGMVGYKTYYTIGGDTPKQVENRFADGDFYHAIEGVRISQTCEELFESISDTCRRILENAWRTKLQWCGK